MAQTASPPVLAPRLPDPSSHTDFTDYAVTAKALATSKKYMHDLFPGQNKPLPLPKVTEAPNLSDYPNASPNGRQRHATEERLAVPEVDDIMDRRSLECLIMLDESSFGENDMILPSSSFTTPSSPSPKRRDNSAQATPKRKHSVTGSSYPNKTRRSLLQLPQGVLGHILAYVFAEERAVSITPYQSRITPQRHRHRHGPNAVDIRSVMMHPALRVCHQMRAIGLNILYRDSLFLIDLCDAGNTPRTNERDAGKFWHCWTDAKPPQMVLSVLTQASNLRFQLPVSIADATTVHGTMKRKKDFHEDGCIVLESLRNITTLITGIPMFSQSSRPHSSSPTAPKALRRKLSLRGSKRRESLEFVCRGDALQSPPREPLSTLEIVLVKPAGTVEAPIQMLEMIAICSVIPVWDNLEYHLEFEGFRKLWAKRTMGKWLGNEPDAAKLLQDLRALGQPQPMNEYSQQFGGINQEFQGQRGSIVDMVHRHRSRPTQDSIDGVTHRYLQAPSKGSRNARTSKEGSVARRIREMENFSKISLSRGGKQPPTVQQLQRIASDIRRGVY
ncbi:uncharacterized protein yc1106_03182 [Curvularia clavata]|uniref:Uncharacterized protein n=1 Tax=Curvularia clavata TaxID=95742 RepID=A0A9Q9DQ51_CURCL|nr:uncharacterized protein yc1106_03182 [Curvularia clavata]